MEVSRFEVFLISLDPTKGREIKKTRPCVVISPNEMNRYIDGDCGTDDLERKCPTRIGCSFQGTDGQIVLDQIRTIDKSRIIKKLGKLTKVTQSKVLSSLSEMFAP